MISSWLHATCTTNNYNFEFKSSANYMYFLDGAVMKRNMCYRLADLT
jgi:hypothetical protein